MVPEIMDGHNIVDFVDPAQPARLNPDRRLSVKHAIIMILLSSNETITNEYYYVIIMNSGIVFV